MAKELQDKIIRLQAQKNQQQSEFIQKKQHYESIIQQLQNENQKLRKYIEDNESFSMVQSQAKSFKSSKVTSPVHKYGKERQVADDERQLQPNLTELVEENKMLKDQLIELTKTYEQQIEQMSNYFNKIQETYTIINQKMIKNSPNQGQINDLVKAYQNLLKDFQAERLKYVEKIQQLTNYIIKTDEKQKKMQEQHQKLQIQLKIVKQELKIYKRSKIAK